MNMIMNINSNINLMNFKNDNPELLLINKLYVYKKKKCKKKKCSNWKGGKCNCL